MSMFTILLACNGPEDPPGSVSDLDHDGVAAPADCDDSDPTVHPDAVEVGGDGVDQDCDGLDPLAAATFTGGTADEGYGSRVALAGGEVYATAPFWAEGGNRAAGRLYRADTAILDGGDEALLGAGLAVRGDGTVLVGAPGVGEIRTAEGEVLLSMPGAGGALAARGDAWVASTSVGVVAADGTRTEWDQRPESLAIGLDGAIYAGFTRGTIALRVADQRVGRGQPGDEAGYAVLLADVGADGHEDLVVGAPGVGKVYLLDPNRLPASLAEATPIGPGTGRFGAALAVDADGALYVGAPMDGTAVEGAVYVVRGRTVRRGWTGEPGSQLGFSLAAGSGSVVAGAPGDAASPGAVMVASP